MSGATLAWLTIALILGVCVPSFWLCLRDGSVDMRGTHTSVDENVLQKCQQGATYPHIETNRERNTQK